MPRKSYQECTAVSLDCPVGETLYGYAPNLGANAFFAALFGVLLIAQIGLGVRTRTWTYMLAVGLGVFGELVGYVGRLIVCIPWCGAGVELELLGLS